jgi:hypothetical protein
MKFTTVLIIACLIAVSLSGVLQAKPIFKSELQIARGDMTLLRSAVASNDTAPTIGTGINLSKYKKAKVDFTVTGTTPSWTVTPLFGNALAGVYVNGTAMTITSNSTYEISVYNEDDFNITCTGMSGTNPTISVYVTPVNDN